MEDDNEAEELMQIKESVNAAAGDDDDVYHVETVKTVGASEMLLQRTKDDDKRRNKPRSSWKRCLPFNCFKEPGVSHRENTGFFEFMTLMWISPIIYRGFKHTLTPKDLGPLGKDETAEACRNTFLKAANIAGTTPREIKTVHFGRVLFKMIQRKYFVCLVFYFFWLTLQFAVAAFVVRYILSYVEMSSDVSLWSGLRWAVLLFICETIRSICSCNVFFRMSQAGGILRSTMLSLIYGKLLRLKNVGDKSVGELINLCASDSQRLFECAQFSIFFTGAVYLTVLATVFVIYYFGLSALVGIGIMLLFIPLQAMVGKLIGRLRQQTVIITDRRVRLMSEILTCIKLIKMYAWEKPFASIIMSLRKREKNKIAMLLYMQSFNMSMGFLLPVLAPVIVFVVHLSLGYELTAAKAYSLIAIFNTFPSTLALLPIAVKSVTEASVAIKRLKNLLEMDELEIISIPPQHSDVGLKITDGDFAWDKVVPDKVHKSNQASTPQNNGFQDTKAVQNGSGKATGSVKDKKMENSFVKVHKTLVPVLYDISFSVPKGALVGVCGPVGCGKSSLVDAILGQMTMTKGTVEVELPIAYVPQQAWIMNSTARENILFGNDHDPTFYDAVCDACSLRRDFSLLPSGDLTEIGERGVNLSGGQKQRLSLARAAYNKEARTYLLDDPLSAVDAHVGKHIFQNCIRDLLSDNTVLFVTHQLQYLADCDAVLYIVNGRIVESGSYKQLMDDNKEFSAMLHKFHPVTEKPDTSPEKAASGDTTDPSVHSPLPGVSLLRAESIIEGLPLEEEADDQREAKGKLIVEEERASGSVPLSVYATYAKATGGYLVSVAVLLSIACAVGGATVTEWWLTRFITAFETFKISSSVSNNSTVSVQSFPETNYYIMVYGLLAAGDVVLILLAIFVAMTAFLRASSTLHNAAFSSILQSSMSFFDSTPTGRILNRLSKDTDELDTMLPWLLDNFFRLSMRLLIAVTIIAVIFPWFLIMFVLLLVCFFVLNVFFRRTVRQLKRLDNTTRSPMFSHITATVQGLSTIHAYGRNHIFGRQFCSLVDQNAVPFLLFALSSRWFALRLDMLGVVLSTTIAVLVVVLKGSVPAALAGLSLTYSLRFTGMLQFTSRLAAESEARFTSVERISQYAHKIVHEAASFIQDSLPSGDWPPHGAMQFNNVCLKYREDMPLVLRDITFTIKPEDKVGVVGRTGAGKSSLAVALFRLTELDSGTITIDGIDISKIGLQQLRSSLSVIPQDPVLFVGTMRYNLDPFDKYTDEMVWDALKKAHLSAMIDELPLKLQTHVVENGSNFSVGERQLICMARALLRSSKILILDEATAAIDSETDSNIQDMIRSSFKSCTMLTIAHRINTVLDCDKILVLDEGRVVEFSSPDELLNDPNSTFSKMVLASNVTKSIPFRTG